MPCTVAGLRHAATFVKPRSSAADKYPVSRRVSRRSLATLASLVAVLALPASASSITPTPRITEFAPLTLANAPGDITAGPDGNLWFTEEGVLPGIGKITTSGDDHRVLRRPDLRLLAADDAQGHHRGPRRQALVHGAGVTADGVARLDPSTGDVTEYRLPAGTDPTAITTGSDGNLWFIERGATQDRPHDAGRPASTSSTPACPASDTLNDITERPRRPAVGHDRRRPGGDTIESFSPVEPR